jgi:phosphate-selective porin
MNRSRVSAAAALLFGGTLGLLASASRADEKKETPPPSGSARASAASPAPAASATEDNKAEKKSSLFPLEVAYARTFIPYDEGFVLRTHDQKLELKLGASAQLDSRFYAGDSVAPHSFDIRRARIDFNAKFYERLTIRIQAALEDNPYVRNAYGDVKIWDFLHLRGGQMKVPFSSTWLAFDNQVDFLERPTAEPLYPFFDRGGMVWGELLGKRITYNFGVFTGAGVDLDANKGDIDGGKMIAWRLFVQPFRDTPVKILDGLYLAGHGTWGKMSVPTRRYETRGLASANYESQIWRWRSEQTLGTNGRNTDQIGAEIDSQTRFGAELNYLLGPVTVSAEWAMIQYDKITIYHDFFQGSTRLQHDQVLQTNGNIHNLSAFVSWFITGEKKFLDNFGWRQPDPKRPLGLKERGIGAFEVLARFSATFTSDGLFTTTRVPGWKTSDFTDPQNKLAGAAPGEGASVNAAVVQGTSKLYEITAGLNWTMNHHLRIQLDYTTTWVPNFVDGKNGIVSAGNSELSDTTKKNKIVESEHMIALRTIFRI